MEEENKVLFNLPYEVKIIEKVINFSVIIITGHETSLDNILNPLEEFKKRGGEIYLTDMNLNEKILNTASEWGCKVERNISFKRKIDPDKARMINERFFADDSVLVIKDDNEYMDYSYTKNHMINLTSNDMALIINDSNIIENFDFDNISNLIRDGKYNRLILNNSKNIGFYNKRDYIWNSHINEYLTPFDNTIINSTSVPEILLKINDFSKRKYTIIELALYCFENERDLTYSKLLSEEMLKNNLNNSVYREYHRQLSLCQEGLEKSQVLISFGDYFMKTNRENDALDYYNRSYIEYSDRRMALYKMGEHFFHKRMWNKCIFYLEGCLKINNYDPEIDIEFHYKDGPYSMLYVCYWWIGDKKMGKYYFDKALEINPYNPIYLGETRFHYEYEGTSIIGNLSFQDTQHLYDLAKKYNNILEIGCDNGRSTHALLNGCSGIVTVITKNNENYEFLKNVGDYGNIRLMNTSSYEASHLLKDEMFDMVYINCENESDVKIDIDLWEKRAKKIICGNNYKNIQKPIDESFEISGLEDNIWYKKISGFEKYVVYKRKEKI